MDSGLDWRSANPETRSTEGHLTPHIKRIVIPVHFFALVAILLLAFGAIETSWLLATLSGWFFISGLGIAIGFHRLLSHKSFTTSNFIRRVLSYLGCLGAQGSPLFWVALHRGVHHPFADTPKDVHSPIHGKWSSYMGWQFKLKPSDVPFRASAELARDPFLKFLHKDYYKVLWGTVAIAALISWKFALFGLLLPMAISIHAENLIDLFCHLKGVGYRNHDLRDNSSNVVLLGLLAFGQGWHNNHHARPSDYNFGGERWFELDPCRFIVPLLIRKESTTTTHNPTKKLKEKTSSENTAIIEDVS